MQSIPHYYSFKCEWRLVARVSFRRSPGRNLRDYLLWGLEVRSAVSATSRFPSACQFRLPNVLDIAYATLLAEDSERNEPA